MKVVIVASLAFSLTNFRGTSDPPDDRGGASGDRLRAR